MSSIIDKRKLIRILFIFFIMFSALRPNLAATLRRRRQRRRLLSRPWPLFLFSMQRRRKSARAHSLELLLHCLLCCLHIYCVVCCCYWFYNLICLLTHNTAIDLHFWLLTVDVVVIATTRSNVHVQVSSFSSRAAATPPPTSTTVSHSILHYCCVGLLRARSR